MKNSDVYSKRVSAEEAREGYVLVLKNQLSFFPSTGRTFRLLREGHSQRAKVQSYSCVCRGPDEPHRHFFVRLKGTMAGDQVVFRRETGRDSRYIVQVHRRSSL